MKVVGFVHVFSQRKLPRRLPLTESVIQSGVTILMLGCFKAHSNLAWKQEDDTVMFDIPSLPYGGH